ncbi:MAG: hypothetical protein FWH28_01410 [Clostridiales bacterium]|nr:hypothetical protein [Clostridiales bacterium]
MKYLYTPYDIAVYFIVSDFNQSYERVVLNSIWENEANLLQAKYRTDKILFKRDVYYELSKFDGSLDGIDELNLLMSDTDHALSLDGTINEQGIIESYFKIMKLELTYVPNREYRKIKLRTLLKCFGYKRRSPQLVENIQRSLETLRLETYLKGYVPCNIAEIDIDDIVMIRLK